MKKRILYYKPKEEIEFSTMKATLLRCCVLLGFTFLNPYIFPTEYFSYNTWFYSAFTLLTALIFYYFAKQFYVEYMKNRILLGLLLTCLSVLVLYVWGTLHTIVQVDRMLFIN